MADEGKEGESVEGDRAAFAPVSTLEAETHVRDARNEHHHGHGEQNGGHDSKGGPGEEDGGNVHMTIYGSSSIPSTELLPTYTMDTEFSDVTCFAASEAGDRAVVVGDDEYVNVWDLYTKSVESTLQHDHESISCVKWKEGFLLLAGAGFSVWAGDSLTQLAMLDEEYTYTACDLRVEEESLFVMLGDDCGRLAIVELSLSDPSSPIRQSVREDVAGDMITSTSFSPDGTMVLCTSTDRSVSVYERKAGCVLGVDEPLAAYFHSATATDAVWIAPTGSMLVSIGLDGQVFVFAVREQLIVRVLRPPARECWAVEYYDYTRSVVVATDIGCFVYDTHEFYLIDALDVHEEAVTGCQWLPGHAGAMTLLTGGQDGTMVLSRRSEGMYLGQVEAASDEPETLHISPDSRFILVNYRETGTVLLHDLYTLTTRTLLKRYHCHRLEWSPDGTKLAVLQQDRPHALIWDVQVDKAVCVAQGDDAPFSECSWVRRADGLRDHREFAAVDTAHTVWIWRLDVKEERVLSSSRAGPGNQQLHRHHHYAHHEDVTTLDAVLVRKIEDFNSFVTCLEWHPAEARLAIAARNGQLRLLCFDEDSVVDDAHSAELEGQAWSSECLCWHPEGDAVIVGCTDNMVRVLDCSLVVVATLSHHCNPVMSIHMAPLGTRIVSVASDGELCVWDGSNGSHWRRQMCLSLIANTHISPRKVPDMPMVTSSAPGRGGVASSGSSMFVIAAAVKDGRVAFLDLTENNQGCSFVDLLRVLVPADMPVTSTVGEFGATDVRFVEAARQSAAADAAGAAKRTSQIGELTKEGDVFMYGADSMLGGSSFRSAANLMESLTADELEDLMESFRSLVHEVPRMLLTRYFPAHSFDASAAAQAMRERKTPQSISYPEARRLGLTDSVATNDEEEKDQQDEEDAEHGPESREQALQRLFLSSMHLPSTKPLIVRSFTTTPRHSTAPAVKSTRSGVAQRWELQVGDSLLHGLIRSGMPKAAKLLFEALLEEQRFTYPVNEKGESLLYLCMSTHSETNLDETVTYLVDAGARQLFPLVDLKRATLPSNPRHLLFDDLMQMLSPAHNYATHATKLLQADGVGLVRAPTVVQRGITRASLDPSDAMLLGDENFAPASLWRNVHERYTETLPNRTPLRRVGELFSVKPVDRSQRGMCICDMTIPTVPVNSYVSGIPNLSSREFLKAVVQCPDEGVFNAPVLRYVFEYRWRCFGRKQYLWRFCVYIFYVGVVTTTLVLTAGHDPKRNADKAQGLWVASFVARLVMTAFAAWWFRVELGELATTYEDIKALRKDNLFARGAGVKAHRTRRKVPQLMQVTTDQDQLRRALGAPGSSRAFEASEEGTTRRNRKKATVRTSISQFHLPPGSPMLVHQDSSLRITADGTTVESGSGDEDHRGAEWLHDMFRPAEAVPVQAKQVGHNNATHRSKSPTEVAHAAVSGIKQAGLALRAAMHMSPDAQLAAGGAEKGDDGNEPTQGPESVLTGPFNASVEMTRTGSRLATEAAEMARLERRREANDSQWLEQVAQFVSALPVRVVTGDIAETLLNYVSFYNAMDWLIVLLTVFVQVVHVGRPESERPLAGLLTLCVWTKILYFATAFKGTAPIVHLLSTIIRDVAFVVMVTLVFSISFAYAFRVIGIFRTVEEALLQTFSMALGDFDVDQFQNSNWPVLSVLLFITYMVIVTLIMLNSLIAIMGESFNKMLVSAEESYHAGRAALLLELEALMWHPERYTRVLNPRFIHVLLAESATHESATSNEHSNRMRVIERNLRQDMSQLKDSTDSQFESLAENLRTLTEHTNVLSQTVSDIMHTLRSMEKGRAAAKESR